VQTPDARPDKRIEFIGDSMTCGYLSPLFFVFSTLLLPPFLFVLFFFLFFLLVNLNLDLEILE
jgi:hypothetical protein